MSHNGYWIRLDSVLSTERRVDLGQNSPEWRCKAAQIRQRKWLGRRLQLQDFRGCFGRDDLAILRVHGSASKFQYCQSGARAQPFPVLRLATPFAQPQCWPAERRSTKRTGFRQARRAVAGKDFPSAPCSILLVLPTRRRRLHPCNAFAPVLTLRPSGVSLPHESLGAVVEIPEQADRQIEYSKSFGGMLVAALSRVSPLLSCSEPRRLMQVEWRYTAKESFPEAPRGLRLAEATANPLAVLRVSLEMRLPPLFAAGRHRE